MTTLTIYTCDKCKKNFEKRGKISPININVNMRVIYQQDWCIPCLQEKGLAPQLATEKTKPTPKPTFEDLLSELVDIAVDQQIDRLP